MAEVAIACAKLKYLAGLNSDPELDLHTRDKTSYKIKKVIIQTPKTREFIDYIRNDFIQKSYNKARFPNWEELLKIEPVVKKDLSSEKNQQIFEVDRTIYVIKEIDSICEINHIQASNSVDLRIRGIICAAEKTELLKKYIEKFYPQYVNFLEF